MASATLAIVTVSVSDFIVLPIFQLLCRLTLRLLWGCLLKLSHEGLGRDSRTAQKNVSLICSAVRGAEATGSSGCFIDCAEQSYATCEKMATRFEITAENLLVEAESRFDLLGVSLLLQENLITLVS